MFSSESKILHHLLITIYHLQSEVILEEPAILPGKGWDGDGDWVDRVVGEVVLLGFDAPHLLEHLHTKPLSWDKMRVHFGMLQTTNSSYI